MSSIAFKHKATDIHPAQSDAVVVALNAKPARKYDWAALASRLASSILPPLIVFAFMLVVWQLACSHPGASLPPPSQVWTEAYDLIVNPFFNNGDGDIGLAWRVCMRCRQGRKARSVIRW